MTDLSLTIAMETYWTMDLAGEIHTRSHAICVYLTYLYNVGILENVAKSLFGFD